MPLSIGIVGLPNVGKSTLFNALTNNRAESSNYPFCTIDPNVGIVNVPDSRLGRLAEISKSEKIIPAAIKFIDIAGLVKGAHKGEGLGNKFLSHIRECDAICEVARGFAGENIIHVNGKIDPKSDRETIGLELVMADLNTVDKRLDKTAKEAKGGDKNALFQKNLLDKLKANLDQGVPVRQIELDREEKKFARGLNLLSLKPILYVLNTGEGADYPGLGGPASLELNIKLEEEISLLGEEEQKEYIEELGLKQSGLDKLTVAAYKLLDLITFFTTGPEETRAWTVKKGAKAPQAAGVIHTDFEAGFIRAEVIGYDDFISAGSEAKARELGLMRTEGKEYIIRDGDVCHFLFNR